MKKLSLILTILACCAVLAQAHDTDGGSEPEYYVKNLKFPEGSTLDQKVDMAARLVPSAPQLAWQQMELTAFLHFGMNTYTNREWGDGTEDPALFNPTDLDADQWVRTLSEAGFKMVIITAKHHDGFCLWPTKTTEHSVANSPWKDGKGDVVRELRDACDRYGMKFGIYLSPWDRNAPCYGDSPAYNAFFIEQLKELLTNYGEVHEVWFDGANGEGPNGKKQEYDWEAFLKVIRELQPNAVTAVNGDDVRWVGNEKGIGRETEWCATVLTPGIYSWANEERKKVGAWGKSPDLGSRAMLQKASALYWFPSEVDVSIRPGWFYHKNQQPKSLKHLVDIYFQSVGYNSGLLLNIPPDTRGRIHESDSLRLCELAAYINKTFSNDMLIGGDGLWKAAEGESKEFSLKPGSRINTLMLQENIAHGQRVDSFTVEAQTSEGWKTVCEGTTIGNKRLIRFPAVEASAIRVTITMTRAEAEISRIGAFYAERLSDDAGVAVLNDIPRSDWEIVSASPLTVDLGREATLSAFTYAPDENASSFAYHYKVEASADGKTWNTVVSDGEFGNIMHNPVPQKVAFDRKVVARYVRFDAVDENGAPASVTPEEFGVLLAAPADDETLVYSDPDAPLALKAGDAHPCVDGWKFYTANEFLDKNYKKGLPKGYVEHLGQAMSRSAKIDDSACSAVEDGVLHMWSSKADGEVDNGFGKQVKYLTSCYRSAKDGEKGFWCNFTENMRIEVRLRRTDNVGFNDALWFMGNNGRKWPACGEIDLLENPKKTVNQRAHFTLHSENHYAGVVGGQGSVTASTVLSDMTQWNIYWLEWYPDRIVGGVNGLTYFEHKKGEGGNEDWPWSDPEGFYMLFSTGISDNPNAWPGEVNPSEWDPEALPSMYIDWVRVYVNDDYQGAAAPKIKLY